jgi:hypothetical protein
MPPGIWTECGGAPTFVWGATVGFPIDDGFPKGNVLPTGPNDGFVPNCCVLEPV